MRPLWAGAIGFGLVTISALPVSATEPVQPEMRGAKGGEPLVDVTAVDPTIVIDLRYATPHNITGQAIYPKDTPCLVRSSVAERLKVAQEHLRGLGLGLKIWDAYRPPTAQKILANHVKNAEFVSDPVTGHSLHTWGVAVDVTLVDLKGKDVPMPTDFDDFTTAAKDVYNGPDPVVARNYRHLRHAMHLAGFYGYYSEWWHYMASDWKDYKQVSAEEVPKAVKRAWWQGAGWLRFWERKER